MTITFNCAFLNCACVNRFGTVIIVKNYFWSSINPNIAVKVPFIITFTKEVINEYCSFKYFYNTTVMPSVLDGGPQILLANILTPKSLICTYASVMAHPVPSHDYVLVNRSILCNCHVTSTVFESKDEPTQMTKQSFTIIYFITYKKTIHFKLICKNVHS